MNATTLPSSLRRRLVDSGSSWGTMAVAVLLICTTVASWMGVQAFKEAGAAVAHTQRNRVQIESVMVDLKETEASLRGYLLSGNPKFFHRSVVAERDAREGVKALPGTLHDAEQTARAQDLQKLILRRLDRLAAVRAIYQQQGMMGVREEASRTISEDVPQQISDQIISLVSTEEALLAERQAQADHSAIVLRGIAAGGMLLALLLVVAMGREATRQVRAHDRAMDRVRQTNDRLEASIALIDEDRQITRALARFAGLLQSCGTVEEAFNVSAHSLVNILPNTSGTLYLWRHSLDQAQAMADWGTKRARRENMRINECWALRQGRAFTSTGPGMCCPHLHGTPRVPTTCVPLRAQGDDIGVLVIAHASLWDRVDMAEAAAEQLALAVANLRLRETLRTQSLRDPLTGLSNRRELEEVLPREIARATRTGEPLSVLALDIDHFKRFNDTHGHEAGDVLLQAFGRMLTANVRAEDMVVRLGGEEFAVILPNTAPDQAGNHAEHLRARLAGMDIQHRGAAMGKITASLGVASYPHHTHDASELMNLADTALYRAKRGGRNRVAVSCPTGPR